MKNLLKILLRSNQQKRASIDDIIEQLAIMQRSGSAISSIEQNEKIELIKIYKENKGIKSEEKSLK